MPREVSFISSSDLVLDVAGVSFIDGREKFLPYNILTIFTAFLFDVPVFKMAQAMGPFKNRLNHFCAKIFLLGCSRIFARGEDTLANFKQLNPLPDTLYRADDIVFLNNFGDAITNENPERIEKVLSDIDRQTRRILGFCPSAVIYKNTLKEKWDYIDFNIRIIERLQAKNYHVLLFPNATREESPQAYMNNDIPVIREILERIESGHQHLSEQLTAVDFDVNSDGIKRFIEKTKLCLVSRFHAMIFALNLKKPLLVIGWSHKYNEVVKQFGFNGFVFDYKDITVEKIDRTIDELEADYQNIVDSIEKTLQRCRAESKRQFDHIDGFLTSK